MLKIILCNINFLNTLGSRNLLEKSFTQNFPLDKISSAVYRILCMLYPDVLHSITQISNKREYQKQNLYDIFWVLFEQKEKSNFLLYFYPRFNCFWMEVTMIDFFLNWVGFFSLSIALNILNFVQNFKEWISSKKFQHLC